MASRDRLVGATKRTRLFSRRRAQVTCCRCGGSNNSSWWLLSPV
ncbi:MAG: hypothetical protein AVDCRST_MAG91-2807 [uncultured Sphingomonadaceae bacterium]|uniref:Uncharacterized protein n=1 Tax=uncultured Sphingomonadaceae bacterium TaxID=169976 RepID=A0A6J4TRG3_9SPHN|nr:MAG: hypothetical protein AVDCRST_MAG91-2807 [uncultured Sphingomonadaceae bacterium]